MRYAGRIFRPPSEAYSLLLQVTFGCSHNTCAFCSMYKEKRFALRPMGEILEDLAGARRTCRRVERIFLMDGDALIRPTADLVEILDCIATLFPECRRVTSYASPGSIAHKSPAELQLLRSKGLTMVYMGLESGSDTVLARMRKGYTAQQLVAAGQKVRSAGMALSVTAIAGLGGREESKSHALATAAALSAMQPEYIGILTLLVEEGTPLAGWVAEGSFTAPDARDMLEETRALVAAIDSPGSVFRMNHASNYLSLAGTFNEDKPALLRQLDRALDGVSAIKPEEFRAL